MQNNLELALKINDTMNDLKEKEKHKKLNKLEEKEKEKEKNQINKNCDDNFNINSIPIDYKERNIQLSNEDFNEQLNILTSLLFFPYK